MSYKFFNNESCEFRPCHPNIAADRINCLFCYCPLYRLEDCPGDYVYTTGGIKDCSNCSWVHEEKNYYQIIQKILENSGK